MSVSRCFTLSCDKCETEYNSNVWKNVLLADAQTDGWQVGKEDLCPNCQEVNSSVEQISNKVEEVAMFSVKEEDLKENSVESIKSLTIDGNEFVIHQNTDW